MQVYLAFRPHSLQVRVYVGEASLAEVQKQGEQLQEEASKFSTRLGFGPPKEPQVVSTRQGVTLICHIRACQRIQNPAILQTAQSMGWKLSSA